MKKRRYTRKAVSVQDHTIAAEGGGLIKGVKNYISRSNERVRQNMAKEQRLFSNIKRLEQMSKGGVKNAPAPAAKSAAKSLDAVNDKEVAKNLSEMTEIVQDQEAAQKNLEQTKLTAYKQQSEEYDNQDSLAKVREAQKQTRIDGKNARTARAIFWGQRWDSFWGRVGYVLRSIGALIAYIFRGIWAILGRIGTLLDKTFGTLWRAFAPYIAIVVFLILLFLWWSGAFRISWPRLPNLPQLNLTTPKKEEEEGQPPPPPPPQKTSWFRKIFPGPNIFQAFQKLSFRKYEYNSYVPRPLIGAGRCDNVSWFELPDTTDPVNKPGMCAKTYNPPPISWILDTDRMPELNNMPQAVRNKVTNDNQRMRVSIPWDIQSTFFVPRCDRATFSDGSSAAYLFRDQGLTCKLASYPSPKFTAQYRAKTNKDRLDNYATPQNPMC